MAMAATARTSNRSRSLEGKNASPTAAPAGAAEQTAAVLGGREGTITTRARMLSSARLRALRVSGNSHMDPRARSAAMAAFPVCACRIETPLNGTLGACSFGDRYQAEREPDEQPRHEPGELGEPAVKEVRGSRQRRDGKEREEAVVDQGEVTNGPDPVGAQSGQEPDESPEEERSEQRQDRLVPDRDPEVPGGGSTPRPPTVRTSSPTYSGVPGRWIYAKALSSSMIATEERAKQPAVEDKQTP